MFFEKNNRFQELALLSPFVARVSLEKFDRFWQNISKLSTGQRLVHGGRQPFWNRGSRNYGCLFFRSLVATWIGSRRFWRRTSEPCIGVCPKSICFPTFSDKFIGCARTPASPEVVSLRSNNAPCTRNCVPYNNPGSRKKPRWHHPNQEKLLTQNRRPFAKRNATRPWKFSI